MTSRAGSATAALVAEGLGTAGLLAAVVGSGIMAERLAGGDVALALLANSVATGAALYALIATFGPISGAHLNPAVTLSALSARLLSAPRAAAFILMQVTGAVAGVMLAHAMFAEPLWQVAVKSRPGASLMLGELVATAGLLLVVRASQRQAGSSGAAMVAMYITAAYWFTSSTSFANPAVTLARALTDSFTGIRAADLPGFLVAELLAVVVVRAADRVLWPAQRVAG